MRYWPFVKKELWWHVPPALLYLAVVVGMFVLVGWKDLSTGRLPGDAVDGDFLAMVAILVPFLALYCAGATFGGEEKGKTHWYVATLPLSKGRLLVMKTAVGCLVLGLTCSVVGVGAWLVGCYVSWYGLGVGAVLTVFAWMAYWFGALAATFAAGDESATGTVFGLGFLVVLLVHFVDGYAALSLIAPFTAVASLVGAYVIAPRRGVVAPERRLPRLLAFAGGSAMVAFVALFLIETVADVVPGAVRMHKVVDDTHGVLVVGSCPNGTALFRTRLYAFDGRSVQRFGLTNNLELVAGSAAEGLVVVQERRTMWGGYAAWGVRPVVMQRDGTTVAKLPAGRLEEVRWNGSGELVALMTRDAPNVRITIATRSGQWLDVAAPEGVETWSMRLIGWTDDGRLLVDVIEEYRRDGDRSRLLAYDAAGQVVGGHILTDGRTTCWTPRPGRHGEWYRCRRRDVEVWRDGCCRAVTRVTPTGAAAERADDWSVQTISADGRFVVLERTTDTGDEMAREWACRPVGPCGEGNPAAFFRLAWPDRGYEDRPAPNIDITWSDWARAFVYVVEDEAPRVEAYDPGTGATRVLLRQDELKG